MSKGLIEEYQESAAICVYTNFGSKLSVKYYLQAIERMYGIVEKICCGETNESVDDFVELLELEENNTRLWAAIHLLERFPVTKEVEQKALKVIKKASQSNNAEALRYQVWLEEWNRKNGK